jgi:glycosidase
MPQGLGDGEHPSARTPMQWDDSPTGGYTTAAEPWGPVTENSDPYDVAFAGRSRTSSPPPRRWFAACWSCPSGC